jgi:GWxTD domain-containing protein
MFRFNARSPVALGVALLIASTAAAQLSEEYAGWADGPAGFLLTKKERKAWEQVATDAAAKEFIELFWARRNQDPDAAFNSFRAEFESKVRYADEHFGTDNQRGALTDRARVLILMGRPEGAQTRGQQQTLPPVGEQFGGSDDVEGSTQVWFYEPAKLPSGFKAKGSQLIFMFYEEQPNTNDYILDRSNRLAFKGMALLEKAPEVLLLHPDLTQVPKPITIAGARRAPDELASWVDQQGPFNEAVRVIAEPGVSDGVHRPLWVHLELPPEAPQLATIAGRVMSPQGDVLSTFEIDAEAFEGQYGSAYHLTIPLSAGSYRVDLVGSADGTPQVTESIATDIEDVPSQGTWMSPLGLGIRVSPDPEAKLGEAFTYGGWHLVPLTGPDLTRQAEVVFFGFIVRPGMGEDGTPDLEARVRLTRDGKPFARPATLPLEASPVISDLYMYGSSIPLSGLPETGSYELEFEIREGISESYVERAVPLEISE